VKVGDLVKCPTANGALGIVVGIGEGLDADLVGIILIHNDATCWFQPQHLEVISESRRSD